MVSHGIVVGTTALLSLLVMAAAAACLGSSFQSVAVMPGACQEDRGADEGASDVDTLLMSEHATAAVIRAGALQLPMSM